MIRLVSVNIERSKHLDVVLPFLLAQNPDVVCIQELLERDIPQFEKIIGPCRVFAPEGRHPADPPEDGAVMEGSAIFSKLPVVEADAKYYAGSREHALHRASQTVPDDVVAAYCDIESDGQVFRIVTTHFTWSPSGEATDAQRRDMKSLLETLAALDGLVITGDFNAPRGGEIFGMLAEKYKDNVPVHYTTSIDGNLHRAGALPYMVDGIFSTPEYSVSDVELHSGISDHMAITATIRKSAA